MKPRATVCREAVDEHCGLAEYCHGDSEFCPDDVHLRDGSQCEAANQQVCALTEIKKIKKNYENFRNTTGLRFQVEMKNHWLQGM